MEVVGAKVLQHLREKLESVAIYAACEDWGPCLKNPKGTCWNWPDCHKTGNTPDEYRELVDAAMRELTDSSRRPYIPW